MVSVVLDFGEDRSKFKVFDYPYSLDVCHNCRELTLNVVDMSPQALLEPSSSTAPPRLSVSSLISSTDHSAVYQATDGERLLVVKFALWSGTPGNLETEVLNYYKLSRLQGTIIPYFFGYYRVERGNADKNCATSCIILEDCGTALWNSWRRLEEEPTYAVFDLLAKFHMEGQVSLNDFEPRNVVERDGVYRIIDLHDLTPHDCAFDGTFFAADGGPLFLLLCKEIEKLAWVANYWCQGEKRTELEAEEPRDAWLWIGNSRFPKEYLPCQGVIDQVVHPCITPSCPRLRMFNGRLYDFFAWVRKQHGLRVAEDPDFPGDIDPELEAYTAEEIDEYREWWKRCGLPTTSEETLDQAQRYRFKKDELFL